MRMILLILLLLAFNPQVERGYVLDSEGNGISVKADGSPVDEVYNYIHYQESESGTEMLSLFLYDPKYICRHEDDSIYRKDLVLSKGNNVERYKQYTNRLYVSECFIVLNDGNVYSESVIMDNKGTETPEDDTVETIIKK